MTDTPEPAAGPDRAPLWDSPWFWLALFAGMALLALVAVSQKYARRQARLEQRYLNQLQAQVAHRTARARGAEPKPGAAEHSPGALEAEYREQPPGTPMSAARARSSLWPLMLLSAAALVVALVALYRSRGTGSGARNERCSAGGVAGAKRNDAPELRS